MTTISVTAKHIAKGVPERLRALPGRAGHPGRHPRRPSASGSALTISISRGDCAIPYPRAASRSCAFIRAFDDGGNAAVEPFTFELDYPAVTA